MCAIHRKPILRSLQLEPQIVAGITKLSKGLKECRWGGYPPEVLGQQEVSLEAQLPGPSYTVVHVFHRLVAKETDGGKNSSFN